MSLQEEPQKKRLKTGITRVRTGCYTCRRRKVKCDEAKPACRACGQLGLRCEGYAPRYKFCDPQTFETIQWATTVVPGTGSPSQQLLSPKSLRDSETSLYPASSASVAGSDTASDFPSSVVGTLNHSKPSLVESSAAGSRAQLDASFHDQFSPFSDNIIDTVYNLGLTHYSESDFYVERMDRSSGITDMFLGDIASPTECAGTIHISAISENSPSSFSNDVYQPLHLTNMNNNQSLGELYLTQWHNVVAPLLPSVFHDITTDMPEFPPLKNAALAITAAYVAHLESLTIRRAHRSKESCYIPQKDHQYQSLQYYNKSIQGIGRSFEIAQANPVHVLAALLLSYYFELDSGSFAGGIGHMTVIDKFLASNHEEIKINPTGQKLLCTWMNLRSQFVNRYLGGYRSSEPPHTIDTFPLNRMIDNGGSHHDSIIIMLCDCKLLSRKIILDWCVTRGESRNAGNKTPIENILTKTSLPKSRYDSMSQLAIIDERYQDSLEKQRARLDKWHSDLDLSELPIDSYTSQRKDLLTEQSSKLDIFPLKFHSFEAAMNYAYYAHAQMLCSEETIDRLEDPAFVEPAFTRKDSPWVELILRITQGLNIAECIYKNTFNAGILPIITSCMVACPRADVASWIEDWLRKVEDFGIPLESGLPFGIIKRTIRFILNQRQNRRHVLLILPLDIEDAEKSDLYHSDFKMQVVVCGKNTRTGKLYNEIAEIPEI
ncbi:hypothetical protein BGW36DRAFT_426307 [Talaromyces proteolyticus]|uniref:Zn(2)-C6 fungal-type domain-containing protein n=1 Tax=Talaromyces proteolyticus TaxID=1131652 RepID=A0AAD4Q1D8_9EURO|nr:uncharacterized protein BGW36DRAFT_426307 [Talaromyces proteolyticus]KAH8698609.1 hypothetical protein BGW36DRAFT_426307 [Talaromyces proteolyticus]